MNKVGDRVGAILGRTEEGETKFLGYGVYEGEGVPIEAVGPIAEALVETKSTNPMIRLDSGSVVYGCECWWGTDLQYAAIRSAALKLASAPADLVRFYP